MSAAVPILMYHSVTPEPAASFLKYSVTPRAFARQMRWLSRAGYTALTLDQLLACRAGTAILPRRPVIITFDDGFQDCVEYAVPTLKRYRLTAVFYLVAGLTGQTSRWLLAERGLELPLMTWAMARQLEAAGFHCGAHSLTHPRLAAVSASRSWDELARGREVLEHELGHAVVHLAYPFGSFDASVRASAAAAGYRTACTVQPGLSPPSDDALALCRVPVLGTDSLLDFICRLHTARPARETARMLAGQLKTHVGWRLRGDDDA